MSAPIERVAVVVPAHNEEATLPDCLAALAVACAGVPDGVRVDVLVVLDRCTDTSAECVGRAGVPTLTVADRNVGRARRAGATALLAGAEPATTWLATTDADSRVPADWLSAHLHAADDGWDAYAGTVVLDSWEDHPAHARARYEQTYAAGVDGPHVHGANLGVRASAYHRAGGFPPTVTAEDRRLLTALTATGAAIHYTAESPVTTSARLSGRAPDGLAGHLLLFH